MAHDLVCWRCGASLALLTLPLRRREECPACAAELHVCRMCTAWNPRVTKQCREDAAEEVRNKEQANFCDYFRPRPAAFDAGRAGAEAQAREQLAALFGGPATGGAPSTAGSGTPSRPTGKD
jgi:ribosomal protein L40E